MTFNYDEVVAKVADTLVRAGSTFSEDKKDAYRRAIASEELPRAKWNLETILENAEVAQCNRSPLCDDTGIPHVFIEVGPNRAVTGALLTAIQDGVREGLRTLPGRPMAIMGNDKERVDMSGGISPDSDALDTAPSLQAPPFPIVVPFQIALSFGDDPRHPSRDFETSAPVAYQITLRR